MCMWAGGANPQPARWLLDTSLMWLSKAKQNANRHMEDDWGQLARGDQLVAELSGEGVITLPVEEVVDI